MLEEKFIMAIAYWHLEMLYVDIEFAKQQVYPDKRKNLTAIEQACLRGLLCRYSPSEIAHELYREPRGLRVDLSRGLYRYIEVLTNQQLKDWRDVSRVLAAAGYQKAANFVTQFSTVNFGLPLMVVSKL